MNLSDIGIGVQVAQQAAPRLAKLKKVASNIEAVFLKDLLAEMRKSVKKVNLGQSYGGDMFQDMMDQQMADSASKSSSFGIGKVIYQQFSKDFMRQAVANVKLGAIAAQQASGPAAAHTNTEISENEAIASKEQL